MKKFRYTAIALDGAKVKGTIEAIDLNEARKKLKLKKLKIIDINEDKNITLFKPKSGKIKSDTVSHFCRQFSIIISSGISSISGLENLAMRTKNKTLAQEINRILDIVKKGGTISEAMLDDDSKFPKLLATMVTIGEETGSLEEVLKSMATYYEREHRINQKIKNASTYPIIVLLLSIVMLFIFTTFIIPQMMKSILDIGGELPLLTRVIMSFSDFMGKYWIIVLIIISILVSILMKYIRTPKGRYKKDEFINKIPLINKSINSVVCMRFSRALHLFVSSGYPMLKGIDHIKAGLNNALAEEVMSLSKDGLIRGETLSENLDKHGYFDSVLIQMVSIGEQTGQLDNITKEMSEFYEQETDVYLTRLVSMIEPVMIIIVGIIVSILVMAVFLPMLSVYDAL